MNPTTPPTPVTVTPVTVTLHEDEALDLAWLLGEVEDWLLHTDAGVLHDLDRFLGPVIVGAARAVDVVARLGHYSCLIGHRHRAGSPGGGRHE